MPTTANGPSLPGAEEYVMVHHPALRVGKKGADRVQRRVIVVGRRVILPALHAAVVGSYIANAVGKGDGVSEL